MFKWVHGNFFGFLRNSSNCYFVFYLLKGRLQALLLNGTQWKMPSTVKRRGNPIVTGHHFVFEFLLECRRAFPLLDGFDSFVKGGTDFLTSTITQ